MIALRLVIEDADFDRQIQISTAQNGNRNDGVFPIRIQAIFDSIYRTETIFLWLDEVKTKIGLTIVDYTNSTTLTRTINIVPCLTPGVVYLSRDFKKRITLGEHSFDVLELGPFHFEA